MKINEVEQLVGVTKRNIRFYEKEGLLNPGRNADNGYRDYTDADAEVLRKIKLLRKLDVPLEEIRKMQQGVLTLEDGLRRHIIQLEREQANLSTIRALCQTLADTGQQLADLDGDRWLSEMERMEGEGTRFVNIHKKDTVTHYIPPVVCALLFVVLIGGVMALLVWAAVAFPTNAPPLPVVVVLTLIPAVFIIGVLLALIQRIKQIQGGEENAASKY